MARREHADLLIVGGGINGAGIARDATGRGLSVILAEQSDLGSATSSASSKLIHGGLRYLEHYEFRLVREALQERERLLRVAPHIIWPLRFVLPHDDSLRPAWMIRLGLFLYDTIGGRRTLPGSHGVDLVRDPVGRPLRDDFRKGFVYSDCWVQDARLVALNAMDAHARGADIRTRTRVTRIRREGGVWAAELEDLRDGSTARVTARGLVNAAGPWVTKLLREQMGRNDARQVRLVKGSHIVLPRLYEGDQAYILQNEDRRIVFVIPYEGAYTLVGTTDVPFDDDPAKVEISADETAYLCRIVNRYFKAAAGPGDVVWAYAGVRPLYDDATENASAVTRDYVLDLEAPDGAPPVLSVFGGKITTFRRLAEQAMDKLAPHFPEAGKPWTGTAPLPGGDLPDADFDRFLAALKARHPWLPAGLAHRYARAYGTWTEKLIGTATDLAGLGPDLGGGLHTAEVDHLRRHEFAETADDILWRRSKLGLHVPAGTRDALEAYLAGQPVRPAAAQASSD